MTRTLAKVETMQTTRNKHITPAGKAHYWRRYWYLEFKTWLNNTHRFDKTPGDTYNDRYAKR